MNDTDLFILSRKQIIDLVQHCGGFETEGADYINARLSEMNPVVLMNESKTYPVKLKHRTPIERLKYIASHSNQKDGFSIIRLEDLETMLALVDAAKTQIDGLIAGDLEAAGKGLKRMIEVLHDMGAKPNE